MSFPQGALIGGRYRLEQSIGSGGMGEVFRAIDTVLGRAVAVKVVHAVEPRKRKEVTESFLREARISAAIAHPNVVQILDFGVHEELAPYIVMELLEGESLADLLGRGAEMPLSFVFELIIRVLDALRAAHAAGVIHRDLKPENIFLTSERGGLLNPKLLDFGISKILDATGVARVTTTHGHIVGTPAYMSPEQARGVKEIDQRTDVYSMGVVLYELLSGDLPFYSENPGDLLVLIMTAREQPLGERVPQLAGPLSDLIERAMAKRPEQRYRDAGEMLDAVVAISNSFQTTPAVSHSARSARANGRNTAVSLALSPQASGLTPLTPVPDSSGARMRRLLFAGLALLAAGLGAAAFALRDRFVAAPPAQRFIVVQADPRAAAAQEETTEATAPPPTPASETRADPTPIKSKRTAGPEEALAQSFRAQRAPVVRCVNAFPDEVERSPKLTLRLSLSAGGDVSEVKLFPPELSNSPLSSCIEAAARGLKFPKQSAPMVFDIPLTARKGG